MEYVGIELDDNDLYAIGVLLIKKERGGSHCPNWHLLWQMIS